MSARAGGADSGNRPLIRVITAAQLADAGISPAAIRTRLNRGDLVRLAFGFYATRGMAAQVGSHPQGDRLLAVAVALAGRGSHVVASHDTAALIHGLDLLGRPGPNVTLTRPPGTGSAQGRPGLVMKVAQIPPPQVTTRYGLQVTSVARAVIDVARTSSLRSGVVTADSALRTKLTSKDELRKVLATCRRLPGSVRAREVVEFAEKLSESALESIARVVFRDLGLPPPQLQVWVGGEEPIGQIGRADFLWKQFATIAEADGALKYADPDRARQQLWRDARLREAGFEVVHFGWDDITRYPENVAASIRAAFARCLALRTTAAAGS